MNVRSGTWWSALCVAVWMMALASGAVQAQCPCSGGETTAAPAAQGEPAATVDAQTAPQGDAQPVAPGAAQPAAQADAPAGDDGAAPGEPKGEEAEVDPAADRALRLGEKAGRDIAQLEAEFDYDYNQTLIEQRETRIGRMVYRRPSEIFIEFTDGGKESFKFDGRVLVENRPKQRQRYVHIFRKPTEPKISVLDVESLPFPHPFGQKREKLLNNYRVEYKGKVKLDPWPQPEGKPKTADKPNDTAYEHLVMTPKPKSKAAKDYVRVEYWLDAGDGLVKQARTEDHSERILTVRFKDVKKNEKAKADDKLFREGPLPSKWNREPTDHTEK